MNATYDWLKQISPAVLQWDEVPLYGAGPEFPWEDLSAKLTEVFQIPSIKITHRETDWRNPEELTSGLSGEPVLLQIGIANLEGSICWAISKSDLALIMEILLGRKPEEFNILDNDFLTGFYHYLTAQTFQTLSQLPFGKNLNPGLLNTPTLPSQPSLCLEIDIALKASDRDSLASGRLIVSPEALNSWKKRWADRTLSTTLQSPLAEKLQVPIHLEIGNTKLLHSEWAAVQPGDFIALDHCSYDVTAGKGRVMLTINGVPMFRAKLKQGVIKILEFPMYHEALMNSNDSPTDDLGEAEEEPGESVEEENESLGEIEEEEKPKEEGADDLEEEAEEKPAGVAIPTGEAAKEKKISPSEIPLNIVVEVGRIQMSMQKLMEIEPGNTLELDVHPENGVDLVVNGRRIGKGELLRIGESLGVRILDIG